LAAVGLAALAGCGDIEGEQQVDTGEAERAVKQKLEADFNAEVRSVRCPRSVEAREGDSFRCTATVSDGSKVPVTLVQKDDSGTVRIKDF
jgi:hypothetical protein